jgi:predicted transcriptional regulator
LNFRGGQPGVKDPLQRDWILRHIMEAGGKATRKDIREHFEIGKSAADKHVSRLIAIGHVKGEAGPLKITQAGIKRVAAIWPESEAM